MNPYRSQRTKAGAGPAGDPFLNILSAGASWTAATVNAFSGLARYHADFLIPALNAGHYFPRVEAGKWGQHPWDEVLRAHWDLAAFNTHLVQRGISGLLDSAQQLSTIMLPDHLKAFEAVAASGEIQPFLDLVHRQADLMSLLAHGYPEVIDAIASEFGFHFESGEHELVDETDRFRLYAVRPNRAGVTTDFGRKPILILPPYVLGANILGFLPQEDRSYAHCYANLGIPTYIRVLKEIASNEALQTMTAEDDALDTRRFCQAIRQRHPKPVTLNGYCQGGYNGLCDLLSGQLDELVDAFITCVAPMDGTRSKGLASFLQQLPERFNDLDYGTKTLANGNRVADGRLMGWVYKLKSIEYEAPLVAFMRDLLLLNRTGGDASAVSKTAAALNYWLIYERYDLPLEITRLSFQSYNTPISGDGTLPVRLFGRALNLKRIKERGLPWLICYGLHDDLVEPETALAPLDHVPAEVTPFPKGHVAIATSWSAPDSACALDSRFGDNQYRGPVRFHLDLDAALDADHSEDLRS